MADLVLILALKAHRRLPDWQARRENHSACVASIAKIWHPLLKLINQPEGLLEYYRDPFRFQDSHAKIIKYMNLTFEESLIEFVFYLCNSNLLSL